ncbi:hypothetical protein [Mesorhizobium sp.]|uniref:hypothetical protein n=1 Tax=Mesorhizobium sp. TaxID=1871066 RepID=UPI000FE6BA6F|nr:hypothetical protein [Mesorhizobium sp.]RWK43876.1 MAG: hypothetical protein EOR46_03270 [Mesorhizobium sp.]RWK66220.1 MAG: hypothetical protein EOR54_25375 [Mesorhizobium sp.]RWK74427.1 MAG: hypothetical protein EOR50_19970 [Mesorhizobium sp.]RWK76823.1 MAG: hypothetical protein EOR51_28175 [Mesorhizobium sp.]RWL03049.1 MAG: hypothetical protein EOR55_20105 [Mesorhizobium sp.]
MAFAPADERCKRLFEARSDCPATARAAAHFGQRRYQSVAHIRTMLSGVTTPLANAGKMLVTI